MIEDSEQGLHQYGRTVLIDETTSDSDDGDDKEEDKDIDAKEKGTVPNMVIENIESISTDDDDDDDDEDDCVSAYRPSGVTLRVALPTPRINF